MASTNIAVPRTTQFYTGEGVTTVDSPEISECLQNNSLINVTATKLVISYSQEEGAAHLGQAHNHSHHVGQVCWLHVTSPHPETELTVDWFAQTCTPLNYVSVHVFYLPRHVSYLRWKSIQWTGCEYKEDPISARYMAMEMTMYVGLHVHYTNTPYRVRLGVRAMAQRAHMLPQAGGKDVEVKHVTPFSGNVCGLVVIHSCPHCFPSQ